MVNMAVLDDVRLPVGVSVDTGAAAGAAGAFPAASRPTGGSGITFDDVCVAYGKHVAIESLNLTVEPGEIMALIGPSGSAKTTALRAVAGF
ncbi:MAG TPA: ATP-binding cassette domain-containing protein, partial [Acidiphilium sp.]